MAGTDIGPSGDWQVKTTSSGEGSDCLDVSPRDAADDVMHCSLANPKLPSKSAYGRDFGGVQPSRFPHLLNRQFCGMASTVRLLPHGMCSILSPHIPHVVRIGSKEKMIGADTESHIAVMANEHSTRNGAVSQFPRVPVRPDLPIIDGPVAVTRSPRGAKPQPTPFCFVNFSPEALGRVKKYHSEDYKSVQYA